MKKRHIAYLRLSLPLLFAAVCPCAGVRAASKLRLNGTAKTVAAAGKNPCDRTFGGRSFTQAAASAQAAFNTFRGDLQVSILHAVPQIRRGRKSHAHEFAED